MSIGVVIIQHTFASENVFLFFYPFASCVRMFDIGVQYPTRLLQA